MNFWPKLKRWFWRKPPKNDALYQELLQRKRSGRSYLTPALLVKQFDATGILLIANRVIDTHPQASLICLNTLKTLPAKPDSLTYTLLLNRLYLKLGLYYLEQGRYLLKQSGTLQQLEEAFGQACDYLSQVSAQTTHYYRQAQFELGHFYYGWYEALKEAPHEEQTLMPRYLALANLAFTKAASAGDSDARKWLASPLVEAIGRYLSPAASNNAAIVALQQQLIAKIPIQRNFSALSAATLYQTIEHVCNFTFGEHDMPQIEQDIVVAQQAPANGLVITNRNAQPSTDVEPGEAIQPAAQPQGSPFRDAVRACLNLFIAGDGAKGRQGFSVLRRRYQRRHPGYGSAVQERINELSTKLDETQALGTDVELYFHVRNLLLQDTFNARTLAGLFDTFGYDKFKTELRVIFENVGKDYPLSKGLSRPELNAELSRAQAQTEAQLKTAHEQAIATLQTQHANEKQVLEQAKQTLEEEKQTLEGEKQALADEIETKQQAIAGLEQTVNEYKTGKRYNKLEQDNQHLKQENQQLRVENGSLKKENHGLTEQKQELEQEKNNLLLGIEETMRNMDLRFKQYQEDLNQLRSEVTALREENVNLKQENTVIKQEISAIKAANKGKLKIPSRFYCPISKEIMQDPVIIRGDREKHCFEREAIQTWFRYNQTHPTTRASLYDRTLEENRGLKRDIIDFMEQADVELLSDEQRADYEAYRGQTQPQQAGSSHAPQRLFQQAGASAGASNSQAQSHRLML